MANAKNGAGVVLRGIMSMVRTLYGVPQITSGALHKLIKNENARRRLVLLDVREPQEYHVSRLPGAIHVPPEELDMKKLIQKINNKAGSQDTPKTVITYCAVGVRASIMAKRLNAELNKPYNRYMKSNMDVYNLEGAIFKWANEERDLEDLSGHPIQVAHPFDKTLWCHLMNAHVRGYGDKNSA